MSAQKVVAVGCASLKDILGLGVKQKPKPEDTEQEVVLPPITERKRALSPEQARLAEAAAQRETTRLLRRAQGALGVYAKPGQV